MKRRDFLRTGAAGVLAAPALATPAIADPAPELKWRLTSSYSKSLDTLYGGAQIICRYVAESTDGRFQI